MSDIPVKSDVSRKVGPHLPRCIYLFMVSTAPDLVLDLGTQRDRGPCPSATSFYLPRPGNGSCCWHGQRCWEPGQGKQLIPLQNRNLHINKCLVTDAFFGLLASLSFFSCPSFLSPWLESWLSPKRAGEWLEEGLDVTVLVSCPRAAQDQLLRKSGLRCLSGPAGGFLRQLAPAGVTSENTDQPSEPAGGQGGTTSLG